MGELQLLPHHPLHQYQEAHLLADNLLISDSDPDCSSKVDVADDCWDVVIDSVVVTDIAGDDIVDTDVSLSISKCSYGSDS